MRVIKLEKNLKHGYLSFIEKDIHNLFVKADKKVEGSGVMDLVKYGADAKKKKTLSFNMLINLIKKEG